MSTQQQIISVFGSANPQSGSADYEAARTVGRLLAEAGFTVQTGGYGGVMAAASQGANEAGGHVIGVTCTQIEAYRPEAANPWVIEERKEQTLRDRLLRVVDDCAGAIVMPGGIGTLSELSLIWSFVQVGEVSPRPIIAVGALWQRTLAAFLNEAYVRPPHRDLLVLARSGEEAVAMLNNQLR